MPPRPCKKVPPQLNRRWSKLVRVCETLATPALKDALLNQAITGFVPHIAALCAFDLIEGGAWERIEGRVSAGPAQHRAGKKSAHPTQIHRPASPLAHTAPPALTALMDMRAGVSDFNDEVEAHELAARQPHGRTRRALVSGRRSIGQRARNQFSQVLHFLAGKQNATARNSVLAMPLRAGSEFLGFITLVRPRARGPWEPEERACAQLLASQVGMALSCMRIHAAAMRAHADAAQLRRVAASSCASIAAFAAAKNPEQVLQVLANRALEGLADGCVVHFCGGPEGRKLVVAHADVFAAAHLRQRLSERPMALIALQRPNRSNGSQPPKLTLPLKLAGVLRGHVTFLRDDNRPLFTEEEQALAGAYVRHACDAISRAWLVGELAQAVRVRDAFVSMASHELRTPLTALQLALGSLHRLAERSGKETIDRKQVVDKTSRGLQQTERLSGLIDTLLQAARAEGAKPQRTARACDLTALCAKAVAQMQGEAKRAGCTLSLEAPGPILGRWDGKRLRQAVAHLLGNALKYGKKKPVTVSLAKVAEGALLRVQDRGIGLSAEASSRIFDRFERGVSAHAFGGLGLGLYLTRQIVRAHGGRIRVQRLATGSQFEVYLPYGSAKRASLARICGRDQEKRVSGCSSAAPTG